MALNTSADPVALYTPLITQVLAQDDPLIVIIGVDRGYPFDALDQISKTTKVLAIEPFQAAADAMFARRECRAWIKSGRITLLVGPDYPGAVEAGRQLAVREDGRMPPVVVAPMLQQQFGSEATRAKRLATQVITGAQKYMQGRRHEAGRHLRATIENIPTIIGEANVYSLAGVLAGTPAIIVGAGPSLDRQFEDLRAQEGRALIIAVDAAVRPLLAAGIRPHLAVTTTPGAEHGRHLAGLADSRGIWLVGDGSVAPEVLRPFGGRIFVCRSGQHHPWPWLGDCGSDRSAIETRTGTLAAAFEVARLAGCDPLIFAGTDLGYSDGQLYCRNTIFEPEWAHLATPQARAAALKDTVTQRAQSLEPGIGGGGVLTSPSFLTLRDWVTAQSHAGSPKVYNATGAGILMGGLVSQTTLGTLHLAPRDGGDASLRATLGSAWSKDRLARAASRARVAQALADPTALPVADWVTFAGVHADAAGIDTAIRTAAEQTRLQDRKARFLAKRRQFYDQRAESLQGAREHSHPDFSAAVLKAPAVIGHVLLDLVERTYDLTTLTGARDVLRAMATLPADLRVLDFGCGIGRTMKPLVAAGIRVDGADISEQMLSFARRHPALSGCQFFVTRGNDCGGITDGTYDLITAHACFGHIPSRAVRLDILASMARALKPGGTLVVHLPFHPDLPASAVPAPHVPWSGEALDLASADVEIDVWTTADELSLVYADFAAHLRDVRLQWVESQGDAGPETEVFISGSTLPSLAPRFFAGLTEAPRLTPD